MRHEEQTDKSTKVIKSAAKQGQQRSDKDEENQADKNLRNQDQRGENRAQESAGINEESGRQAVREAPNKSKQTFSGLSDDALRPFDDTEKNEMDMDADMKLSQESDWERALSRSTTKEHILICSSELATEDLEKKDHCRNIHKSKKENGMHFAFKVR